MYFVSCVGSKLQVIVQKVFSVLCGGQCTNLQPLVDGLSCSELSRLKAFELLGGDGLWELELQGERRTFEHFATKQYKTNEFAQRHTET